MPKRTDIKSIMIIGAGPIVIGQACEFDYSGTQACRALKEEGYRVILVNSNPATIMTDPATADATYIEPITPEMVERIIAKERPDAILPTMGGQTGLNTGMALDANGVLAKYNCELIGANAKVIDKAEDREKFRDAMTKIGLNTPNSAIVNSMEEAKAAMEEIGLPVILRPSFTMGGIGGGIAYNAEEYMELIQGGLDASPVTQVLVEQSVLGWKEFEMEVVRDKADNCIIICSIENIDPMGVHTGDSVTVAPALTLSDKEYQIMRDASIAVLREIGVDTGGSNVQFAVNPENGEMIVIEMNPRVSRSSALASKATGFPIAKIAAKLAVGYTLDELDNDITGGQTPASFEPSIDYIVTKIPRFTFEKFPGAEPYLTTAMKSVGEAMSFGRSFQESLQKGLRSMETGLTGLNEIEIAGIDSAHDPDVDTIRAALSKPTPDRLLVIAQAFRFGLPLDIIQATSKYDPWFLEQVEGIVIAEGEVRKNGLPSDSDTQGWMKLKRMGFSDDRLAEIGNTTPKAVAESRRAASVRPIFKRVDTCAGEFATQTSYMYSAYENFGEDECNPNDAKKVIILGGGPNRIGQGIEFDYCCVHAAYALSDAGYETIMINCNPETVSTDYDTSDRLYFEPLTDEDVIEVIRAEQKNGSVEGVIVQLGGQTPLKLSHALEAAGIPILGTSPDAIDLAEDRERFQALVQELELLQPENGIARSVEEAVTVANRIGYPSVVRPSYVLGGRAMEIVHDEKALLHYMRTAVQVSGDSPVLLDRYLQNAIEVDVDAICDGEEVYIAGIMEHIEEAGIHSGDSACSLPPHSLSVEIIEELRIQTKKLAHALHVVGLMNIQFAIKDGTIYLIEVNPRASRTVPFVAKATGCPVAKIAARVMAGEKLTDFGIDGETRPQFTHTAVKEAVFPFKRFPGVDIILGPEMRSTGEVMGIDQDFAKAFAKSQFGAGMHLPEKGTVFISVKNRDKENVKEIAQKLSDVGFSLIATSGTQKFLTEQGLDVTRVNKVLEGRPHCVDAIINGDVQMVINTTEGAQAVSDSFPIRRSALTHNVSYYTTITAASAMATAIASLAEAPLDVAPIQSYFKEA